MDLEKAKQDNFDVNNRLECNFEEVNGYDFYRFIFPNNERAGDFHYDYSQPNAIYLYTDEERDRGTNRNLRRRVMLDDTWEDDFIHYVEGNPKALCSGLTFRGRVNRLEHAQQMNAFAFDLDAVGADEIKNVLGRLSKKGGFRRIPYPTFIVASGTGLHLYYVLEEPVALFPNIKIQLKALKHDLTFNFWEYKGTSQEKNIQYQPLNQAFRMPGSYNNKYDMPIRAYRVGDRVSLEHLNEFARHAENKVDLQQSYAPTKYTLEEAKEKFPAWYEKVIVQGNKEPKKWHVKRDLYEWWKRQAVNVIGGHRYYFMMCMAIYAIKCNVSRGELEDDLYEMFDYLKDIEHTNALEEMDIISALEAYDRSYYNFTIDDIEKLTNMRIDRNKRNYRNQKQHTQVMSAVRDVFYPNGEWRNLEGRPIGTGKHREAVLSYLKENPNVAVAQAAKDLGVSRPTIYKYKRELSV